MDAYPHMAQLVSNFARDLQTARELSSPNPQDDLRIKTAIVGFCYNSSSEDWGQNHYSLVKGRLESAFSPDELDEYGERGENVALFTALCLGFLLGLYQTDMVNDEEFALAEAQLPGLIALHSDSLVNVAS